MAAPVPLPARTDVAALAMRAVTRASAAAAALARADAGATVKADRVAVAYTSERWLRFDGRAPVAFAPLSGFFPTSDAYVRTHANYPHHRAALLRALGMPDISDDGAGRDALAAVLRARSAHSAASAITAAGGLCVIVRAEAPRADAALRRAPLVEIERVGAGPVKLLPDPRVDAPLRGIRVLDLTRVIAGPVATRTLALLGAEVLRIDPPRLPELAHQHLDTGHGKRSAQLDLAAPAGAARFGALLAEADIVALGYRPAGLARRGITPATLAAGAAGVVVLQLSAWGSAHADTAERRGFDSLVQAESGIAMLEGQGEVPGALPAQALDHSAGYLLAAAAMELLARRARVGGSWLARTSLRRVAAELLGMPRTDVPAPGAVPTDAAGHTQTFDVAGSIVTTVAPALAYPGSPAVFAAPRPWGQDEPAWL